MKRSLIATVALATLASSALAQITDISTRLRPRGPIKYGGIYHVASNTWTRPASTNQGPVVDTIYNNTCDSPYFAVVEPGEIWVDEGRVPGTTSPDKLYDPNQSSVLTFVGTNNQCPEGMISAPGSSRGSAASYSIDAITIGYCSNEAGGLSVPSGAGAAIDLEFRSTTGLDDARCPIGVLGPAPFLALSLTNFPGRGAGASPFACWVVAIDLTGMPAFTMTADGNGIYPDNLSQATDTELDDCFSWSFSFPNILPSTPAAASGFLVAGATENCGGYDGTVWDHQEPNAAPKFTDQNFVVPPNANGARGPLRTVATTGESGTGMTTQGGVRIENFGGLGVGECCRFDVSTPNPIASFHLELYTAQSTTISPLPPGSGFCFGDSCAFTCPCVAPHTVPDPSGGHESGCANSNPNFLFGVLGTRLHVTGNSVVSAAPATDTVRFLATGGTNGLAFLVRGNTKTPNGVFPATADGIRCASGALVRFGAHNQGTNGDAVGSWSYPNTAQTTTVSSATAQSAGQAVYYQLFYRNPAPGWCGTWATNFSNGQILVW